MTLAQTIVEIDTGDTEAIRLRGLFDAAATASHGAGDLVSEARWRSRGVVTDAIRDALRRARDGCEELG